METTVERLQQLEEALNKNNDICSSCGPLNAFPPALTVQAPLKGIGLIVCDRGSFDFAVNHTEYSARAGESVFVPEDCLFRVVRSSDDLEIHLLTYRIEPIREILGNSVVALHLYSMMTPNPCYVWQTGEEESIVRYMALIDHSAKSADEPFSVFERKLLLMALTYRLCSLYSRKLMADGNVAGHKTDMFIRLLQLIDRHYMQQRSVEFYADKLCLTPKYLSALSKSICGYTVQELVFKSIIRKAMSLLDSTTMSVQDISDAFNFPNPSYFGTFFRKQTGMSPQQYRNMDREKE